MLKTLGLSLFVILTTIPPAFATFASPPTCRVDRFHYCIEKEIMPDGSSRCVKCGRRYTPWYRPHRRF